MWYFPSAHTFSSRVRCSAVSRPRTSGGNHPVVNRRHRHHDDQQQTQGIHDNLVLPPGAHLAPVGAPVLSDFGRLDPTMQVDTDAKLFDRHGALEALPSVAPTPVKSGATESPSGKSVPDANIA